MGRERAMDFKKLYLLSLVSILFISKIYSNQIEKEQFDYNLHCLGCHGMEGKGITDVPPFPGVLGYFLYTQAGREFIIQVPGVSHSDLNNKEIANLTNWILRKFAFKELPPNFKEYTEEEVQIYRSHPLVDVDKRRKEIIQELKSMGIPIP